MRIVALLIGAALIGGCDGFPKDPDGTLDRVRREGRFSVGLIASDAPVAAERQRAFLARVARAAGARPEIEHGAAEPLLERLKQGELDLVLGQLSPKSPWKRLVSFLPPLAEVQSEHGRIQLIAAAAHGENAWIALLHGPAADLGARR